MEIFSYIYALLFTYENEKEESEYKSRNEGHILRNTFVICIVNVQTFLSPLFHYCPLFFSLLVMKVDFIVGLVFHQLDCIPFSVLPFYTIL